MWLKSIQINVSVILLFVLTFCVEDCSQKAAKQQKSHFWSDLVKEKIVISTCKTDDMPKANSNKKFRSVTCKKWKKKKTHTHKMKPTSKFMCK